MTQPNQSELENYLGIECQHEFRQLNYQPKYIARDFEVKFYCIYCLKTTAPCEVMELPALTKAKEQA